MTSTIEHSGAFTVLTIGYETIDTTTIGQFRRDLDDCRAGQPLLVVDLLNVRFIDSSGLGALLSAPRQLAAHGGARRRARVGHQDGRAGHGSVARRQ